MIKEIKIKGMKGRRITKCEIRLCRGQANIILPPFFQADITLTNIRKRKPNREMQQRQPSFI